MNVKCKHCGVKEDKSMMVKIKKGSVEYYSHPTCEIAYENDKLEKERAKSEKKIKEEEDKTYRECAINLFYEYTKSLSPIALVNVAFKKCKEKGLNYKDILYTMEYIVKNKMVLNYPMGILYYIDRAMKDKKELERIEKNNNRVSYAPIKFMPLNKKISSEVSNDFDVSDLV